MVFKDISFFDTFDDEWLAGLICTPDRKTAKLSSIRSAMMLNPLNIDHLNNIDDQEADIIVINLEDGVAPKYKKRALLLAAVFISNLEHSKSKITVRVNPFDKGGKEEILFLNKVKPDAIRVSKVRDLEDIENVLEILHEDIKLHLSIETSEAFSNLRYINLDGTVEVCYLGILDLLNDMKISQSILQFSNPTIEYIMSRFLIDCKIAGVTPIGFTYQNYNDLEGYKNWCKIEKIMGYGAKSCLGPKQVLIANEVFKLDDWIIERARHIKDQYEEMIKEGVSGFMDQEYGFIDEPIYKDALLVLDSLN